MSVDTLLPRLLSWPQALPGEVLRVSWRAYPALGVTGTALALALMGLVLWLSWRARGADISRRGHVLLFVLRTAALCCLLPALFDLSLQVETRRRVPPILALALDTSQSMTLVDRSSGTTTASGSTRLAVARDLLQLDDPQGSLGQLARQTTLLLYAFDRTARPLTHPVAAEAVRALDASGEQTALGDSLNAIVERLRGQPNAGILVLSDGANNSGSPPLPAAARWRDAGVPIHTVAIGDANPRDIEIRQVFADDLLFRGDPATVIVRLRQRGYVETRVPVVLRRGAEELARGEAVFASGETEINLPLRFVPSEAGEQTYRVECQPLADEAVPQNNRKSFAARVTADHIRVLVMEQRPRWQFRFLRDAMARDQRLKVEILLVGSEPTSNPAPPYVNALPATRQALESYDLLVIGDVDPAILTDEQAEWIRDWVREDGGGLLLLAGPLYNPAAFVDTALSDLFPIEPAQGTSTQPRRPRASPEDRFLPALTPMGRTHTALELADGVEANLAQWGALPPLYWYAPARRTLPGAMVLATHPAETMELPPHDPQPLLVLQHFGRGSVFYCGVDETWRWRFKQGDRVFYRLWGQIVQYLGAPHLTEQHQRISLRTDRVLYSRGETALFTCRSDQFTEGVLPAVIVEDEDGRQVSLALTPSPGANQLYETSMPLTSVGLHKAWVEGHALEAGAVFEVQAPQLEMQDPAANVALLAELSAHTGGIHAQGTAFADLINRMDLSPRPLVELETVRLWDRMLLVLLFVALLGTEWVLRRLWQLP